MDAKRSLASSNVNQQRKQKQDAYKIKIIVRWITGGRSALVDAGYCPRTWLDCLTGALTSSVRCCFRTTIEIWHISHVVLIDNARVVMVARTVGAAGIGGALLEVQRQL